MEERRGRERALYNLQTHFKAKAKIFKAYQDMGMPCTTKRLEVRIDAPKSAHTTVFIAALFIQELRHGSNLNVHR